MADKRIIDYTEAASAGADYYLVTDSASDGVKKIKPTSIVPAYTGDVTSTAGGTVNTIAANAVTNSKAAQMAAGTIKSNLTGALASASDNTINAVMDAAFGSAQGAVAYRGTSGWSSLAPGVSGQFMQTGGPSANPVWQTIPGGGNMLSSTYDPTSVSSNVFDGYPVADRAALKALDTTQFTTVYLHESGREGQFIWKAGDYSTLVAADPLEGVYVKATAIASTYGAWVRAGDWMAEGVSAAWFGVSMSSADNTSALNAFHSFVTNVVKIGRYEAGTFDFATALDPIVGSAYKITGPSRYVCWLNYVGASAGVDLVNLGDGSSDQVGIVWGGVRVISATTMIAPSVAVRAKRLRYSRLPDMATGQNDPFGGAPTIYDGLRLETCEHIHHIGFSHRTSNEGVTAYANPTGSDLWLDDGEIWGGGYGIHIGGGFGGVYTGAIHIWGPKIGLLVDTAIVAIANGQFFISERTIFDSTSAVGGGANGNAVLLLDALGGSKSFVMQGWCGSSGANGFAIGNWTGGTVSFVGAQIASSANHGIYVEDTSTIIQIDAATDIKNSGGFGVTALSSTNNIFSDANPHGNASGSYFSNCNVEQLGTTGFRKHGNGRIHQWGTIAPGSAADVTVTYPRAFSTLESLQITVTDSFESAAGTLESIHATGKSTSGFTGRPRKIVGTTAPVVSNAGWTWEAWGR